MEQIWIREKNLLARHDLINTSEKWRTDAQLLKMINSYIWWCLHLCLHRFLSLFLLPLSEECREGGVALCLPVLSHNFQSKMSFILARKLQHTHTHTHKHCAAVYSHSHHINTTLAFFSWRVLECQLVGMSHIDSCNCNSNLWMILKRGLTNTRSYLFRDRDGIVFAPRHDKWVCLPPDNAVLHLLETTWFGFFCLK